MTYSISHNNVRLNLQWLWSKAHLNLGCNSKWFKKSFWQKLILPNLRNISLIKWKMTQISLNQFCFPHHCFCVSFPDGCTWKLQGMGLYQMINCFRVWITGALPLMETEHWSIPNLWSVSQHRSTQSIGSRALEHSQFLKHSGINTWMFSCSDPDVTWYLLQVVSFILTAPLHHPKIQLCKWGITFLHSWAHNPSQ